MGQVCPAEDDLGPYYGGWTQAGWPVFAPAGSCRPGFSFQRSGGIQLTKPVSVEEAEAKKRCGHLTRAGVPCKQLLRPAEIVCFRHGGKYPQVKSAEQRRKAERDARFKFKKRWADQGYEFHSAVEELEVNMAKAVVFREIVEEELAKLDPSSYGYEHEHGEQLRAIVGLYERCLKTVNDMAVQYERLGIAERKVRIDEAQAVILVSVIKNVLNRLDLNREQKVLATTVVSEELRAIEAKKD